MQNLSQNNPAQQLMGLLTAAVQALQSGNASAAESPAKKALSLAPSNPDCHLIMATVCHNLDRTRDAERHYAESLRLKPDNARALTNLGMLQLNDGRGAAAIPHLKKAVSIEPQSMEARHYLARALAQDGQFSEAVEQFALLEPAMPQDINMLLGYARAVADMADHPRALKLLKRVLDLQPDNTDALSRSGEIYGLLGQFDDAEAAHRRVLAHSPRDIGSFAKLSAIRRLADEDFDVLEQLLNDVTSLKEIEHVSLLFVMGAQFEKEGAYDRAFAAYQRANQIPDADSDYSPANKNDHFEQLTLATVGSEVPDWPRGHETEAPVFIVGMPRSGTTLVEQILAAHPLVFAGGEQQSMTTDIVGLMNNDARYTPLVEELNADQLRDLAEHYLNLLPEGAWEAERVTDKMPGNLEVLPLIVRMFPNAKIILCRRHPMDVAWSIYKQRFSSKLNYATNLSSIAHQQKLSCAFMEHWKAETPDRTLEVCYERLTEDFEAHARKIIDFVGLEWHDDCLEPHSVERVVQTASLWQVRQPVYRSSVGQWRNYETHLADLRDAQAALIAEYEAKLEQSDGS